MPRAQRLPSPALEVAELAALVPRGAVGDPDFDARVVAETRALLASVSP